jgi:hypothetical protein
MTTNEQDVRIGLLELMREPFAPHQISHLPKGGTTLSYVGHAALTDRLLRVDPLWTWEPMALTPQGLPLFDETGGLWIRLTVCGHTRLGYGHAAQKKTEPGAREKEVIGDALRNAAMRFGAALDLWHKGGDLHGTLVESEPDIEREAIQNEGKPEVAAPPPGAQSRYSEIVALFRGAKTLAEVTEIQARAKAEWGALKNLPGAREGLAGARNSTLQRVS